jgi:Cytochrome c554 and c-prime
MPTKCWRGVLAAGAALGLLALACCFGRHGTAASWAEQAKIPPEGKFYYGAEKKTCGRSGCHSGSSDSDEMNVYLGTEFTTWQKEDKHAKAYQKLLSPRSKRMGELLWNDADVTKRRECLSCHAAVIAEFDGVHNSFALEQGVTCVVCHGPSKKWVDFHQVFGNRELLRSWEPAKKEKEYELADLWTPSKRAALCLSCHMGSIKSGEADKFVTHEMYAAGHPPLPSFETATFSDQMPRHWRYRNEKQQYLHKKFSGRRKETDELLSHYREGEERTRLALASAAVSLRESMLLLKIQAEKCKPGVPDRQALDMANFDCYACHHDLKSPSWRQKRGYSGKPGRPPMRPWPTALIKLASRQATGDAEAAELVRQFDRVRQQVQSAVEERPYGNPEKLAPAASDLAEWANRLAERLDNMKCDTNDARKLLSRIPALFQDETLDYDSARQVAWTFQITYQEVGAHDPRVLKILDKQDSILQLHLPSGQERDIPRELKQALERRNNYDPDKFKETLQELAKCFEGKSPRDAAR